MPSPPSDPPTTVPSLENDGAPPRGFDLVRALLPRRAQPLARGLRRRFSRRRRSLDEPYRSVYPFTQVSLPRQQNLVELCCDVDRSGVEGAVVECGVLDGGTAALMAHATAASRRPVHLFDAWRGMPDRTEPDGAAADKWVGEIVGSQARVRQAMKTLGIDANRVTMHRGWFHETFPAAAPRVGAVAVLHVDCDFYEPTRLVLETWYPRLSPGGYVQFDDYTSFAGCRTAVDAFLAGHPEVDLKFGGFNKIAAYLQKPRA